MNDYKNDKQPYLLIDSSYVSFHIFFATIKSYIKINPDFNADEEYEWTNNKIFMDLYDKKYIQSINTIRFKYSIPPENIIIARDCRREQIWRMKIYPEYKATRKTTCKFQNKQFNIGNIFKHIYANLYPKIEEKFNYTILKIDDAEADDVIAVMSKKIHEIDKNRLIVIITNDNDYLQLINEKILIWNLQNQLLNSKVEKHPNQILLQKIILGDISDNIKPCLTQENEINDVLQNKSALNKMIETNNNFKQLYERNKTLIDFNYIPQDIKKNIINKCSHICDALIKQQRNEHIQKLKLNNYNPSGKYFYQ